MTLTTTTRAPFWRCRVFRHHRWVVRSTDDGSRYEACARCGCDRPDLYDLGAGGTVLGGMLGGGAGS